MQLFKNYNDIHLLTSLRALYLLLWFSNSCQQNVEDDCSNYRNPSYKESLRLNAYRIEKRNEN